MSWSISAIGSPSKIIERLEAESERISSNPKDRSRAEFDEAKPHLIALVKQNIQSTSAQVISLSASGSASWNGDEKTHSNCAVKIEGLYGWVG
jgi:hypothetical protein